MRGTGAKKWLISWAALLVILLTYLFFRPPVGQLARRGKYPDIEFTGLVLSELVSGTPRYTLAAQTAVVYLADQQTDLGDVRAAVPAAAGVPAFNIHAQKAQYDMQVTAFQFADVQLDTVQKDSLHIETTALRWQPGDALLQCDGKVVFKRFKIQGYALRALADLKTQHVTLFNGVHAQIQP